MVSSNDSPISSLLNLSLNCILKNLPRYTINGTFNLEILPVHIKNKILDRMKTAYVFRDVNFKEIFLSIANADTNKINLLDYNVDDELLDIIGKCTNLVMVHLSTSTNTKMSTAGLLRFFANMKKIVYLDLAYCDNCNDSVIASIAANCPYLTCLNIAGCKNVTDEGIRFLAPLKNLKGLTLSHTNISDVGISHLVKGNSGVSIKELQIEHCNNITENVLQIIADNCPNIELLYYGVIIERGQSPLFQSTSFKNLRQLSWSINW